MRTRWAMAVAGLSSVLLPFTFAGVASEVVWRGDMVREISTTDIDVYEMRKVGVRIPRSVELNPTGGEEEIVTFPTSFRIDVEVSRTSTDHEGFARPVTVSPLGTVFVATSLDPAAAGNAVREAIRGLQILSPKNIRFPMPKASGRPGALFSYPGSPFFSDPPTWICFEPPDGAAATEILLARPFRAPDGATGIQSTSAVESPTRHPGFCRQMREAFVESAVAETYFSRPSIETAGRQELVLSVHRPGSGRASVPLPEGVGLKTTRDGPGGGASHLARSAVADFPLSMTRSTSVVMHWVLDGSPPGSVGEGGPQEEVTVPKGDWILAIYPPMSERPAGDIEPALADWEESLARRTETEFRRWIGEQFEDTVYLAPSDVEKVVMAKLPELLGSDHSLVVLCDKEDSGSYQTYPGGVRTAIKNGTVFCPELRRALDSAGSD